MRFKKLALLIIIVCLYHSGPGCQKKKQMEFPEFEFDIWGDAPQIVKTTTRERVVQKMLFTIKDKSLSTKQIAEKTGEIESTIEEKLTKLKNYDVVHKKKGKWISNIPLYIEKEIREGERVGLKYAEMEAAILREEMPKLKELYNKTIMSRYFPWDRVSLIIVGAFLADFCVVDRIPFKTESFTKEMQLPLGKEGQKKWGYEGFEILPKRFPSRKWMFYQNVESQSKGGTSRFGYFRYPDEERKSPPARPDELVARQEGEVLFALAEGPLTLKDLEEQSKLENEILMKALGELSGYDPPAVIFKDGKYWTQIPILTESDLKLLLPELDRIAVKIFQEVVMNHLREKKERAKELGYKWPLPSGMYVRDKALQILIEEGLLCCVQDPPVDWNFNVWGWKGFLRMHDQLAKDLKEKP